MNLTLQEAYIAVADLFEANPEAWTRNTYARMDTGTAVYVSDPKASKFCAVGALRAIGFYDARIHVVACALGYSGAGDANDRGGRLVVIRILRMAAGAGARVSVPRSAPPTGSTTVRTARVNGET